MKRFISGLATSLLVASSTFAGGFLTNTNQNVAFLRNPARDAAIGIDGVYSNPAGVAFLPEGWHLSLNIQSAYQQRIIDSEFAPFILGEGNNGRANKRFKGKAEAPVIPSFQLAYIANRWSVQGSFAIVGGGGKCTFPSGLGSFESQVSLIPAALNAATAPLLGSNLIDGYSADMYMKGKQYYYGLQAGANYKATDNLSLHLGGRLMLADCNYYGYVRNITLHTTAAGAAIGFPSNNYPAGNVLTGLGQNAGLAADRALDADQSGWSFQPVIGADYKTDGWNFAAKYEFKGKMKLKNQSNNTSGVAEFDDGEKVEADMPALLTFGTQYAILPNLRASAGYHHFFDKDTKQYGNRQQRLKGDTQEFLLGVEYDVNNRLTASIGGQRTHYNLGKDSGYLSDMSFNVSSYSVGLGVQYQFNNKLSVNVAYFKTFYEDYHKTSPNYLGTSTDYHETFTRTNDVFGINLNIAL